jgi:hypothetical protein
VLFTFLAFLFLLYFILSPEICIIHKLFTTLQISLKRGLYKIARISSLYLTKQVTK